MRRIPLLFFFIGCWLGGLSQEFYLPPDTKMSVDGLLPLNFVYSTQEDLMQQKVMPKAIRMVLKVNQEACLLSVTINVDNAASPFANKMLLALSQTNSPDVTSYGEVSLSPLAPSLVFLQPGSSNGTKYYEYFFDFKLNPPDVYASPAITNFSIIHTISLQ